jgi:hypothetical protein
MCGDLLPGSAAAIDLSPQGHRTTSRASLDYRMRRFMYTATVP